MTNSVGRKRVYRKPVMKLLVENSNLSINDLIDKLPHTNKDCPTCGGQGIRNGEPCQKCKIPQYGNITKKKVDYNAIFREIKSLELEDLIEELESIKHKHGKPTIKYAITTEGAKWYIDNNQSIGITKFIEMMFLRANEENNYKFIRKETEKKEIIFLKKLKREIGFKLDEVLNHYENHKLQISRDFLVPLKIQKNISRLQYLSKTDIEFLKKIQPILGVLCKHGFLTYGLIFEKIKSHYNKNQFEKIFNEIASKGMIYLVYKNDRYVYCLSHAGLILFLYGFEETDKKSRINSTKKIGEWLFPHLFQKEVLQGLLKDIKPKNLLFSIFLHHCYNHTFFFHPLNELSKEMLWLINNQDQLVKTYHSTYFDLYFSILRVLDAKIKKKYPHFEIIDKSNKFQPRISKFFRDLFYYAYRTGKNLDTLDEKEIGTIIEKSIIRDKLNPVHLGSICENYDQILSELFSLDQLIYGDDVDESPFIASITEFTSKFKKNGEMVEFKSWIFLKNLFPEVCGKIIDEHKDLKNWVLGWEKEIKKFSVQNNPFYPRQV